MPIVGQAYRDRRGLMWEVVRVEDENELHRGGYRVLLRNAEHIAKGEPGEWWFDVELDVLYADGGMTPVPL